MVEMTRIDDIVSAYVASDYCDRKESVFVLFLKDCYTQEERNEMMKRLLRCHCCSRHSHYKDNPDVPSIRECKCHCRHYARLFKRNNLAES